MTRTLSALLTAAISMGCAAEPASDPTEDCSDGLCDTATEGPAWEECAALYFSGTDTSEGLECFRAFNDGLAEALGQEGIDALARHRQFEDAYGLLDGLTLSAWQSKMHEGIPFMVASEAAVLLSSPARDEDVDLEDDIRIANAPERCLEEYYALEPDDSNAVGFVNLLASCTSVEAGFLAEGVADAWAESAEGFETDIPEMLYALNAEHSKNARALCRRDGQPLAVATCIAGAETSWYMLLESFLLNAR